MTFCKPFTSFLTVLLILLNSLTSNALGSNYLTGTKSQKTISVFAAGDIADCRKISAAQSMAEKTAQLIETGIAQDPDAIVLTLGDNTYPIGKLEEFSDCYDKSWGRFKRHTLPSPGNHDYGVPSAAGYFAYFKELAGTDQLGYYKKNVGSWLLLSLNSNLKNDAMRIQIDWLNRELKENKQSCLLAFWHHPVFSSGGHGDNQVMFEIWQILAKAKTDIVLTSHDHNYERLFPLDENGFPDVKNGIHSFVVGTGGAHLTPMFFPKNITQIRNNETYGVLKLALSANSFTWKFLPVSGQAFSDSGQGVCH